MKKRNKGITLIALVITIIVLLILVGISIATLTGENGVLTKADIAKAKTEKEGIKEEIKLAYNAIQQDAIIERWGINRKAEELQKELRKEDKTATVQVEGNNLKVRYKGEELIINEEGNVDESATFNPEELTIGTEAKNIGKYGWKVPEYTVTTNEFTTGVWRLFYQDSNYTYLITDELVGRYILSGMANNVKEGEELKYKTGEDVSIVGRKLNSKINSLFTSSNDSANIKVTACLTDTSDSGLWNEYKNKDAVFAIGAPTIELFVKSLESAEVQSGIELAPNNYGYETVLGSTTVRKDDCNGIYNKDGKNSWCIASPSSKGAYNVMTVNGVSNQVSGYGDVSDEIIAIRPVVCISTEIFNQNYTLVEE